MIRSLAKGFFTTADLLLRRPNTPRLLIYHQVGAGLGRQMEVSVDHFEWQLNWLVANREVVDLDTALRRWDEVDAKRLVVLTFDDGYRDTFEMAFPRLKELGMPFTLYLATEPIETQRALGPSPAAAPLQWSQVEELLASGLVTLGSHTHRHTDLRGLSSDHIDEELSLCDDLIEMRTGVRPRHFAYPWGYWSEEADRLVRERYSAAALGAIPLRRSTEADPYLTHRFPVQLADGRTWFTSRLRGGFQLEEEVRRRMRGYRGP